MARKRKESDPDFKLGSTHNKGRSTYVKESIKADLQGEQKHNHHNFQICIFPSIINNCFAKTVIALAETGDVSSSQGSQEMEVEAPTSRGDGGGGNVAKDKVQGGDTVKGGIKGKRGKRKRKGWDKHKKGEKGRGKEDIARKAKVDDKIEKIMRAKENLENPYDEMDIDTKKSHALFFYNDEMSQMLSNSEVAFSTRSIAVKERVAKKVGVSVRTMKRWVLEYWSEEEVKKSRRGKHSKCESPIDDVEFRASFCQYVRSHAKPKGV